MKFNFETKTWAHRGYDIRCTGPRGQRVAIISQNGEDIDETPASDQPVSAAAAIIDQWLDAR